MRRFKNILAYVDVSLGKSDALGRAVRLARRNGANLTVVDVAPDLPVYLKPFLGSLERAREQQKSDRLRALTGWMRGEPVKAQIKVLHGRPFVALTRQVLLGEHDLLIKDVHMDESASEMMFGGVDLRLLRNCPCPVWLVKPGHHKSFERVLAAIDPQPSLVGERLNEQIIGLASSMAEIEGSDLFVVGVWEGVNELPYGIEFPPDEMLEFADHVRTSARKTLDDALTSSEIDVPQGQIHFETGNAGVEISRVADEVAADLIVMGTVARTGIPNLLIGNTAERILRKVRCSVLAIKPDGFVSPIKLNDEDDDERRHYTLQPN